MELDKFNELLSSDEVKTCQLSTRKTWYTMPLEVFTSFIFKQEIAAAAGNAVRKFNEDTPPAERTKEGVAAAMRTAIKESTEKLYKKLSKIVAVANLAFGPEFLQEMEEVATELFESIIRTDNIRIDMFVSSEPLTLLEYMEGWQMKLWDSAYTRVFKGDDAFKKSDSFKEFRGVLLAVKCLIYRYFKFELYSKKAIEKADLPLFLTTWLDRSSYDCMFSPTQLKNWTSSHLQACPWYLECNFRITPPEEEVLFRTLKDTMVVEPEFDEFSGLDPEAQARAIKKREAFDKRNVDKMKEAKRRTEDKKKKR